MKKKEFRNYYISYSLIITFLFLGAIFSSSDMNNRAIFGAIMGFVHSISIVTAIIIDRKLQNKE